MAVGQRIASSASVFLLSVRFGNDALFINIHAYIVKDKYMYYESPRVLLKLPVLKFIFGL